MTMRRDPLLSDEERELAAQLARIAPRGEPSADLDARILAMAERGLAGVAPVSARHRRRGPQRWPVWLGLAASLTVVAGLVWRLEPALHPRQAVRYEAPASVAADNDPNGKRQPIDYVETAAATDAAMPPPPPPMEPTPAPKPVVQARRAAPAQASAEIAAAPIAAPPPAPPAPPNAANAAARADAAAAKAVATDSTLAQEAPRRPAPASVGAVAGNAPQTAPAPAAAPPPPPAAPVVRAGRQATSNAQAEAIVVESTPAPAADRAGFDARPPITADTAEVQRAWLKRIRELREGGEIDAARDSLAAFVKRNPKAEIPADLKPLLPASPPSTPP